MCFSVFAIASAKFNYKSLSQIFVVPILKLVENTKKLLPQSTAGEANIQVVLVIFKGNYYLLFNYLCCNLLSILHCVNLYHNALGRTAYT